jgi:hypothetical protein
LFMWVIPAVLFIYSWFSFRPFDASDRRGLLGTDCASNGCIYTAFITVPLVFSVAYSAANLVLSFRPRKAA